MTKKYKHLSDAEISQIKRLRERRERLLREASELTFNKLGKLYDCSPNTIYNTVNCKTHKSYRNDTGLDT